MAIPYRSLVFFNSKESRGQKKRFIVSRKGDEVQPALEAAMEAKMTAELDVLDDF